MAEIHAILAAVDAAPDVASQAARRSDRELSRARLLTALAELAGLLQDEGPFLVQVRASLADLQRAVDRVRVRVSPDMDAASAQECAELLDDAAHEAFYAGLLELVEPSIRRVLRRIDSEAKTARLAANRLARASRRAQLNGGCMSSAPVTEPLKVAVD